MADEPKDRGERGRPSDTAGRDSDRARRERFARAITRAMFGRHYWDEGRQAELKADTRKKPRK